MIKTKLFQPRARQLFGLALVLLGTLCFTRLSAQVKGVITDAGTGEPLIGASILVKGTVSGTVTGLDGDFTLAAKEGDVLQVSYTGFTSVEVPVGPDLTVNVALEQGVAIDEIVVTGYQTLRKRDISGAISVVRADDLKNVVASSFAQKLAGRASGVTVSTSGSPGDVTNVRIRGISSFGNNDPLYIIDGIPVQDKGNLNINPNDIQSMQVLKDASTASIYGSRASNGVIVITTKQGSSGRTRITYNGSVSAVSEVKGWNDILITDSKEYVDMTKQFFGNANQAIPGYAQGELPNYIYVNPSFNNGSSIANTVDESKYDRYTNPIMRTNKEGTDWWDAMTRTGITNDHNLSITGGNDKAKFALSAGYLNQQGVLQYNKFDRANVRLNSSFNIGNRIRIGENLNVARRVVYNSPQQSEQGTLSQVYKMAPLNPVYDIGTSVDEDGNRNSFGGSKSPVTGNASNPVAILYRGKDNFNRTVNILGNIYGEIDLIKGMMFKTVLNVDQNNFNSRNFSFRTPENEENQGAQNFSENWSNGFTWTWSNSLSYNTTIGKHVVGALAGYEAIKGNFRNIFGSLNNYFSSDINVWYLNSAFGQADTRNVGSGGSQNSLLSTFGKVDYSYDDTYFLSATIRRDGSSRFSEGLRYGTFPAFSAAWRVTNTFLQDNALISDLKLRASWGKTGNQNIQDYNFFDRFGGTIGSAFYSIDGSNSSPAAGFTQTSIGTNSLGVNTKWEESESKNIGFDASLMNDRLTVVFDLYQRNTIDLLYNAPLPGPAGTATAPFRNVASMKNNGVDLTIGYKGNITQDLKFNIDLNLGHYKNEILKIDGTSQFFYPNAQQGRIDNRLSTEININQIGYPISSFRGYTVDGIFANQAEVDAVSYPAAKAIGGLKFKDLNGDKVINDMDLSVIGSPHPDLTAGLNIGLDYKNWNLTTFLFGSFGNEIFNYNKLFTHFRQFNSNVDREYYLNNGKNGIPKLNAGDLVSRLASTYYVEDGTYVRMGLLQLGYNLPTNLSKRVGLGDIRVYVQSQNLFTITNYSGLDPSLSNANIGPGNALNDIWTGFDIGQYPSNKMFTIGIQAGF